EPGKILHELRVDEMSASGELPYAPYYGSIDSTPLYLMLAAEYYNWTADLRTLHALQGAILAALGWIDVYGDIDHDDYVEYEKRSARGLVNQGWKDSWDAIMHAEGPLATPPITLVEVQGYVYAARRGIARVLSALGMREEAERQLHKAQALRRRFNRDFWLPQERYYALALDGEGRPCASIASNPGHALWTGIVRRAHAEDVVGRLLSNELFSGWGIRTLSTGNIRYNPIGYHNGTVWPHDNAICAMGFKVYGFEEEVNELATALFDAACTFPYYRLPELFGGQPRTAHGAPVPYPVACRPQGWAAGSFPMILQAILGLRADAPNRQLRIVRPTLPYWLGHVQIRGLRVGRGYVDLRFFRRRGKTVVEVTDSAGGISVVQPGRWSHRYA
ncbi:MAG TPA: amylo-alpha-1,6-glucosidase, partial [Dehalococcoidia bacterium]|nr:amylo-alpha-1,6-glucosidase [Dehalococcoidia bacterium]